MQTISKHHQASIIQGEGNFSCGIYSCNNAHDENHHKLWIMRPTQMKGKEEEKVTMLEKNIAINPNPRKKGGKRKEERAKYTIQKDPRQSRQRKGTFIISPSHILPHQCLRGMACVGRLARGPLMEMGLSAMLAEYCVVIDKYCCY